MADIFFEEPSSGLCDIIIGRIKKEKRSAAVRKTLFFLALSSAAVVSFIPSLKLVSNGFKESGFFYFLSLAGSDFKSIMPYWKAFLMVLLESLPAASLMLFFTVVFLFLKSLYIVLKEVKIYFKYGH